MKATRPHPPPERLRLCERDGVCATASDFADRDSAGNTRKILLNFCGWERNEQPARRLRIHEQCSVDAARTAPLDVRFHINAIAVGAACRDTIGDGLTHFGEDGKRGDAHAQSDTASLRYVQRVAE